MNFAALQRYAPLLSLGSKAVGSLKDDELRQAATALAGDNSDTLFDFFKKLRSATPETVVSDVLGSDAARDLLSGVQQRIAQRQAEGANSIFCTCPNCNVSFETELN